MHKTSTYVSKPPDDKGYVDWDKIENNTWRELITQQMPLVRERACQEYLDGLEMLHFSFGRAPQLPDVSAILRETTGWQVHAVPCLINFDHFFELLASRNFPCATFLRTPEDMYYLQEPDLFHEIFGHCPLFTNPYFADFTEDDRAAVEVEMNKARTK